MGLGGLNVAGKGNAWWGQMFQEQLNHTEEMAFTIVYSMYIFYATRIFPPGSFLFQANIFKGFAMQHTFQLNAHWNNLLIWFTNFSGLFYVHIQNCIM